jgi:hypothetical protein
VPTAPDLAAVKAYLGDSGSWDDDAIDAARLAEIGNQSAMCRLPVDPDPESPLPYPADLAEALCRRVAHNLALRALPLGVQANVSDMSVATTRVGGMDAEVRRLEGPYRKLPVG